ncbi:MAG: helix-hairpin-helix domain-containing protein [Candidatus Poribacteria bacterium]
MIYLTHQEQRIVILLCALILVSAGVVMVNRFQPGWFLRASMGQPDIDMRNDQARSQYKHVTPAKTDQPINQKKTESEMGKSNKQTDNQQNQSSKPNSGTKKPITTRININTATADELMQIPSIGPVKARAIIDYRKKNGKFTRIDDLTKVSGIGEKTLDKIRDSVTIE